MNKTAKLFTLAALGAVSLTQGCSCSSDKKNSTSVTEPPPVAEVSVEGTAVKGVVGSGLVSAFTLTNGVISSTPIKTALTDALGKYTIKIPETYIGKPIVFRITPALNDVTQLTCDIDIGCGIGINFGSKYPLPTNSTFSLNAIVPALNTSKKVHISTFSELAYTAAKSDIANLTDANAILKAVQDANSSVAVRFGLEGDVFDQEPIDITDKAAVKAALAGNKGNLVRAAALNASILQASMSTNAQLKLEEALAKFVTDYKNNKGIAGNTTQNGVTDYKSVLDALVKLLTRVQNSDPENIKLDSVIADISSLKQLTEQEAPDTFDGGRPRDNTNTSDAAKTVAFANVIRELIAGDQILLGTHVGDTTIGSRTSNFEMQLQAAQMGSSRDLRDVGDALGAAANAVIEGYNAYRNNSQLTTYSLNGVTVAITTSVDKTNFTVDQTLQGVATKLIAQEKITTSVVDNVDNAAGKLTITEGSASNTGISLSIGAGSVIEATKITRTHTGDSMASVVDGAHIKLGVQIAQKASNTVTDPISMAGALEAEFAKLATTTGGDTVTNTGLASLSLSGIFKNKNSETFVGGYSIKGDSNGANLRNLWDADLNEQLQNTLGGFSYFSQSLSFSAGLGRVANAATFSLVAARASDTTADLGLHLTFGTNDLRLSTQVSTVPNQDITVKIANQDGLLMQLTRSASTKKITGSVVRKSDNKQTATITTTSVGTIVTVADLTEGNVINLVNY